MAKHLGLTVLLGILCHIVLLGFELPVITSAAQGILAQQPIFSSGAAGILVAHALINTGLGVLLAGLAKPQAREALIYGGIAAGLPNTVCTFVGAMLIVASEGGKISSVLGVDLLSPGAIFGVLLFSLFTGLLAAPLGVAGAVSVATVRK